LNFANKYFINLYTIVFLNISVSQSTSVLNVNIYIVAIKKFKESSEDKIVNKTTKREVKMLNYLKDKSVVRMIEAFKR
jgi:hypothetical protein